MAHKAFETFDEVYKGITKLTPEEFSRLDKETRKYIETFLIMEAGETALYDWLEFEEIIESVYTH